MIMSSAISPTILIEHETPLGNFEITEATLFTHKEYLYLQL